MAHSLLLRLWRCFIVFLAVTTCYFIFKFAFVYVYPFLFGAIISFFINPLVSTIEQKTKIPRPIVTIIVLCFLMSMIAGTIFLVITEIFQGTLFLADKIPYYFQSFISIVDDFINNQIIPLYQKIISLFYSLNITDQEMIIDYVQQLNSYIATKGASLIQNFFIQIPALLAVLPSSVTVVIFTVLATFFLTNDWEHLKTKIHQFMPALQETIGSILDQLKETVAGYIKGQLILMFITCCIIYSGLLILNIKHALTISLLTTLIDMMPVIGTGLVFIPWILYLFLTGNHSLTIGLIILYMIVIIIRQFLEPKVLTASVGVHPLVGLIILFVSLQSLGGAGLIATPLLLILFAVFQKSGLFHRLINYIKG